MIDQLLFHAAIIHAVKMVVMAVMGAAFLIGCKLASRYWFD